MTQAGWYADPADLASERFWDGEAWTDRVRPATSAVPPAPVAGPPAASADTADTVPDGDPGPAVVGARPDPFAPPPVDDDDPLERVAPPTVPVVGGDASTFPSAPTGPPPAPTPAPSSSSSSSSSGWGAPRPAPAVAAAPVKGKQRTRGSNSLARGALIVVVASVVLGGTLGAGWWYLGRVGTEAGAVVSRDGEPVALSDVVDALGGDAECRASEPIPHTAVVDLLESIEPSDQDGPRLTALAEANRVQVRSLDRSLSYSVTTCDTTVLYVADAQVHLATLGMAAPGLVTKLERLGVGLTFIRPIRTKDVFAMFRESDVVCTADGEAGRAEMQMEVTSRIDALSASGDPAAVGEARRLVSVNSALAVLPATDLVRHRCGTATLYGTTGWTMLADLADERAVSADELTDAGMVYVL